MRLKLDENIGRRGADLFKMAGHDVATVWDQRIASATDVSLIDICRNEGRALITLDLDFANPMRFSPDLYKGIAVLRLPHQASNEDLHGVMKTLIGRLERDSLEGKLWVVQLGVVREYRPDESNE